jgi:hypothetical protein
MTTIFNRAVALFEHVDQDIEARRDDLERKKADFDLFSCAGEDEGPGFRKALADVAISAIWLLVAAEAGNDHNAALDALIILMPHDGPTGDSALDERLTVLEKRLSETGSLWNPNK